jgi:hypothetical protein
LITLQDLESAIKECEGQRNPSSSTALKLAAFYTIKNELYPSTNSPPMIPGGYSYASPPVVESSVIDYGSDTDFGKAVNGKETQPVMAIMDDLMTLLQSAQPRLHKRIIREIENL